MTVCPSSSGFPWQRAMQIGLGELRLPPQHFWSMTPKELAAAAARLSAAPGSPPERETLNKLMQLHPDYGDGNGTD